MNLSQSDLRDFLEEKLEYYNQAWFIEEDPISIPHRFSKREDIEIAGFFAATLAWGKRSIAVQNINRLLELMDQAPYDFVMNAGNNEFITLDRFVHRTFNSTDLKFFIQSFRSLYEKNKSLEEVFFYLNDDNQTVKGAICRFRVAFLELPHPHRTEKHLADPGRNASAKRINMFLRWMIRKDAYGVDLGLWKNVSPSILMCPLDLHSGNVARKLGLLQRKASDWKAVEELTENLRLLDPDDPVKYDLALFGLGIYEKFA
ncbi:MAG: TIGR02757 family protein [Bacteroidales bacterium]